MGEALTIFFGVIVFAGLMLAAGAGTASEHTQRRLSIESGCARYNPTTGAYEVTKKCPWDQK